MGVPCQGVQTVRHQCVGRLMNRHRRPGVGELRDRFRGNADADNRDAETDPDRTPRTLGKTRTDGQKELKDASGL